MRLSDRAAAWIRQRVTPGQAAAIRSLAESENPAVRELFQAMREVIGKGFDEGLGILGPALALLHDEEDCNSVLAALEREVPAVRQVLEGYAMLDVEDRLRTLVRAWNCGQEAVVQFLVQEVAESMLAGMIVERARGREHACA